MKRRSFIKNISLAGMGLSGLNTMTGDNKRFDTYMKTTKPVLDFYSKNPNFYEIDGSSKIEEIKAKIDNFMRV